MFKKQIRIFYKKHRSILIIISIVIIANSLFLFGFFKGNPFDQFSGAITFTHEGVFGLYSTIDPNSAYTTQALGHLSAKTILDGHLPWWNLYEQIGAPLAGEMQAASLFLPFIILMLFTWGFVLFHIILELIAGLSTYYLLKKLKCSEIPSLIGGILFSLNGSFSWFGSANVNPIAFLPLLILGIEIALDKVKKNRAGGWILISIALAYSIYSGFPEVAFLDGMLAGLWFIVRLFQIRRLKWKKFLIKLSLGFVTGLLLSAPLIVAFLDFLPYANTGGHSTGLLSKYSLPFSTFPAFLMPYIYGPIFQFVSYDKTNTLIQLWDNSGGYITFTILFFALVGIIWKNKQIKPIVYLLAIYSLVVLARIYGFPGFVFLFNLIPGIKYVAFYRYVTPALEFSLILLAAIGLDALINNVKIKTKKIFYLTIAVLLFCSILAMDAIKVNYKLNLAPHHYLWFFGSLFWSICSVLAIFIIFVGFKKYSKYLFSLILIFDVVAMFVLPQLSAPIFTKVDMGPVKFLQNNLQDERFYSIGYIMPNYGSYFGIASINTNNSPVPKVWTNYITKNLNSNVDPMQEFTGIDKLNPNGPDPLQEFFQNQRSYAEISVKYLVIKNTLITNTQAKKNQLNIVYKDNHYSIYQLRNTRKFYNIVHGNCLISLETQSFLKLYCKSNSVIERQELYMPGWTAINNGKIIQVYKYKNLFQFINVSKGRSTIVFNYTPKHENIGYLLIIIALLITLISFTRFINI